MTNRITEYKVWREKRFRIFDLYLYGPNLTAGCVPSLEQQIIITHNSKISAMGDYHNPIVWWDPANGVQLVSRPYGDE